MEAALLYTARRTVSADAIELDFQGTLPVSPYGINLPLCYAQAYASFGIRCVGGGGQRAPYPRSFSLSGS
jgi:N-methylhydantoinase B